MVDAAGRPVSGAWVSTFDERTLYDFEGPPRQFGFARCQTDEAGLFHLKKIQAGVYTLYVAPSGPLARRGATQAPGLLVESGKETRAGDIVLAE